MDTRRRCLLNVQAGYIVKTTLPGMGKDTLIRAAQLTPAGKSEALKERRLSYTYRSSFSGKEDTPEICANIAFEVVSHNDGCKLKALLEVKNASVPA